MATKVDVSRLDEDLRELVRKIGEGEHLVIEEAGRPIATIVPTWEASSWEVNRQKLLELLRSIRNRASDAGSPLTEADIEEAIQQARDA